MIEVEVSFGLAHRQLKSIRDPLIITERMGVIRGRQELANTMNIVKSRTIGLFKPVQIDPGSEVSFSLDRDLDITGNHMANSYTLTITPDKVTTTVVVEQYVRTP